MKIFAFFLYVLNLLTFAIMGADKHAAKANLRRVPERIHSCQKALQKRAKNISRAEAGQLGWYQSHHPQAAQLSRIPPAKLRLLEEKSPGVFFI